VQATLTLSRQSPDDVGIREVIVSLDGERLAVLMNGQSVTKHVAPGEHKLRLYNTLVWKNIQLDLKPGEHAKFQVINRAGFGTLALVTALGVGPIYLKVDRET
jgi:hypothetical protein